MVNLKRIAMLIIAIMIILAGAIIYFQAYGKNSAIIFPEKLEGMNKTSYKEGDSAIKELNELHNYNLRKLKEAYIVEYGNDSGNKAKFWVSETENNDNAIGLVMLMSNMVGKTGMYGEPTSTIIDNITVYFTKGAMEHMGLYHYFYAKNNDVYWIQIDSPDEQYRIDLLKETIRKI